MVMFGLQNTMKGAGLWHEEQKVTELSERDKTEDGKAGLISARMITVK